ncbi:MAG: hypothetical protein PVH19_02485 [Planctomycetia bacterium]|jgi:flagellar M-ring protein FliF
MDFLNQVARQISELFRSMTPGAKIAVALLLAVLGVSLFFLFSNKISGGGDYLFAGESFSATQIQKMEAAFGAEGLSGYQSVPGGGGFKVKVEGNKASYIAALVKHKALPPNCYDAIQEALTDVSPFTSPTQINEFIHNGKTIKLTQMISDLQLVAKAEVMFHKGKKAGLSRTEKSSAAILIQPVPGESLDASYAKTIQQMAADALSITANDVTVVDGNTGHCFSGNLSSGEIGNQIAVSAKEAKWQQNISNLIGIEGMKVVVNIIRGPYKSHVETVISPDKKKTVAQNTYEKTGSTESESPATKGRPGIVSNAGNRIQGAGNMMSKNSSKDSETSTNSLVGGTQQHFVYDTDQEQQINVSIRLPSEHYIKIWQSRNPTKEGEEAKEPTASELAAIETEEIQKTKQSVTNLLQQKGVADPSKFVDVTTYQSFIVAPSEGPGMMGQATAWIGQYWTVLGLFVLALLSLRALRTMMRSVPVEVGESHGHVKHKGMTIADGEEETVSEEEAKAMASEMLRKFDGKGPSLRDELTALVSQDADTAATILSGWIGSPTKT